MTIATGLQVTLEASAAMSCVLNNCVSSSFFVVFIDCIIYPLREGEIVQDFRSKQEKNLEMLLFRLIDSIASKKKIVHDSSHNGVLV